MSHHSASQPRVTRDATAAFYGSSLFFLAVMVLWNVITLWLLDISVFQRMTLAMGVLASMFATMVMCKVVRDRQEARELVNEVRTARYEDLLAKSPAPGLGEL